MTEHNLGFLRRNLRTAPILAVAILALASQGAAPRSANAEQPVVSTPVVSPVASSIQNLVQGLHLVGGYSVDLAALDRFYRQRNYAPAWSGTAAAIQNAETAISALRDSGADALEPASYRLDAIVARKRLSNAEQSAEFDVLLSDSVLRYMIEMRVGRVRPWEAGRDIDLPVASFDAVKALGDVLAAGDLKKAFAELAPPHPEYPALKAALARYDAIEKEGGWPELPGGRKIALDGSDERIVQLRKRLAIEDSSVPATADEKALEEAVERYQLRNGIEADGKVGTATIAALNVTASQRAEQIKANMERWRWLPFSFPATYIEVNTADATLKTVDRGNVVLSSRIITGKRATPTPMFVATVTAVTVNPFWNIPPSIARNEIVPKSRRNSGYLESEGIVFDSDSGMWKQFPGDKNALGKLKLEMPNRFNSYLHDTPSRRLFAKTDRHFSHGCMRVEQIRPLASFALSSDPQAALSKLDEAIQSGTNQQFRLDRPLPVYVLYWTVIVDQNGSVEFRPDVYGRDGKLLAALAGRRPIGKVSTIDDCHDRTG